jgi:hypothetical protein
MDDLDYYRQRAMQLAQESRRLTEFQLQELQSINATFDCVLHELHSLQQAHQQGVHLQQALLAREVFQDQVEEFVYNLEKTPNEFAIPNSEFSPELQFFQLRWIIEEVDSQGISTVCIRGRDNKATFDACLKHAKSQYRQLAVHPDVQRAIAVEESERRRLLSEETERNRLEAERQGLEAERKRQEAERKQHEATRSAAKRAVQGPATALLVAGFLGLFLNVGSCCLGFVQTFIAPPRSTSAEQRTTLEKGTSSTTAVAVTGRFKTGHLWALQNQQRYKGS